MCEEDEQEETKVSDAQLTEEAALRQNDHRTKKEEATFEDIVEVETHLCVVFCLNFSF